MNVDNDGRRWMLTITDGDERQLQWMAMNVD